MRHPDPGVPQFHLVPLLDVGPHFFHEECPCGAFEDCPGSIHHMSYDGREAYEPGGGRTRH